MNCFLTGTDTDVGKTYVASLLIRGLRKAGMDSVGMKPICCGDRRDAELLHEASGFDASMDDINPVWLRTPAAPYAASIAENRTIDLDRIKEAYARLRAAHKSILVEGVGGWLVPIRKDYLVSDLAAEFSLPVVVVVRNRLGALNHALLTVESIKAHGLECSGLILNNLDERTNEPTQVSNASMLEDLAGVPVLFHVARGQSELTLGIA